MTDKRTKEYSNTRRTYFPSEKNRQIVRDFLAEQDDWLYKSNALIALRDAKLLSWSSAFKTITALIEEGEIEVEVRPNLKNTASPHAGGSCHYIRLRRKGE